MNKENSFQLNNTQLVLPDAVVSGSIEVVDGKIVSIDEGSSSSGYDCRGDYLIPGLVEIHTDHLEGHYSPRPGVRWNPVAAIQAHDAQIASAGITTVLDCLRMGTDETDDYAPDEMLSLANYIQTASEQDRLRAEHFLHLRCEVSSPNVLDDCAQFHDHENIIIMSLMDHAPGQRQFTDFAVFEHHHRKKNGMDENTYKAFSQRRIENSKIYSDKHRKAIASMCRQRDIALASHDDATADHVADAVDLGVCIAEFPTTVEAAKAAHEGGQKVLMGAPNVVRGHSHSGNVGARELAALNMLDVLSSDYVPISLLHAPFVLSLQQKLMSLPAAIALVTSNPAAAINMDDRGSLATGLRADMVLVRYEDDVPCVKCVWRAGVRVA